MDGAAFSVVLFVAVVIAVSALAVAFLFTRRSARKSQSGLPERIDALVAELRRSNDLVEQRVADQDRRLARLEERVLTKNEKD